MQIGGYIAMKSISFDNPLWLLLLIPLLLGIVVPFIIAIRRENRSRSVVTSLVLHLVIATLVTLAAAGTVATTVITKTEIYVLADVSYSARGGADEIDGYIGEIYSSLPRNSRLGVVCFGKDTELLTPLGEPIRSVSESVADSSATDIASALRYTEGLFSDDVLRRIVLITDGRETVNEDHKEMSAAVESLAAAGIAIDAIYVDSNVRESITEVQLTSLLAAPATYLNHKSTLDVFVEASRDSRAIISLYRGGEKLTDRAAELSAGMNVMNIALPTDTAGDFDYEVVVSAEGDVSAYNNKMSISQSVAEEVSALVVAGSADDARAAAQLFGSKAKLDIHCLTTSGKTLRELREELSALGNVTVVDDPFTVPVSVEALAKYDEIFITGADVRSLHNVTAFLSGVEKVVSEFGKSLVTFGDIGIQNKSDDALTMLEDMLPVRYGNSAEDPKLYVLVMDTSRSMFQASRLAVAKQAAVHLLNVLNDEDEVIVVTFAGDVHIIQAATEAKNREDIAKKINASAPEQGTSIAGGMKAALDMLMQYDTDKKEVMLISDGMNYTAEIVTVDGVAMNAQALASYMNANGVSVSTINPYNQDQTGIRTLQQISTNGGGEYYYLKDERSIEELVFSDIADDLTESVINGKTAVNVKLPHDDVLRGISFLPSIYGYVQSKAKVSATTPLTVDYYKTSGTKVEVPLYSYWAYGNGNVASYTSSISGEWAAGWQTDTAKLFYTNLFECKIPDERISIPYSVNTSYNGIYGVLELVPAIPDPMASVALRILSPSGEVIEDTVAFNKTGFIYTFLASENGKYTIEVTYTSKAMTVTSSHNLFVDYSPEYDAFATFDPSLLYAAIRHRGTVTEGAIPDLEPSEDSLATMRYTFALPFLALAVALFVIDVIIRKIKWRDIASLFSQRTKGIKDTKKEDAK